jgi:hypothetical protein
LSSRAFASRESGSFWPAFDLDFEVLCAAFRKQIISPLAAPKRPLMMQ